MKKYLDKFNMTLVIIDIIYLVLIALVQIISSCFYENSVFLSFLGEILEFILLASYLIIIIYSITKIIVTIIKKNYKMLCIPIISIFLIIISTLLFLYEAIKISIVF